MEIFQNFRSAIGKILDPTAKEAIVGHVARFLPGVICGNGTTGSVSLHGVPVPIRDLSDGYGSLLALVGHLFQHALQARDWAADPITVPALALIDEIDLHLHPAWQRRIMRDLSQLLPNLQIVATSHSAMVAGSVEENALLVLRRDGATMKIERDFPSVTGWRADQILTSLLFDLPTTRDIETEQLFERYARMLRERGPSDDELKALGSKLQELMGMTGEGAVDLKTHQLLEHLIEERLNNIPGDMHELILAKAGLILSQR